jgi:hypothetical protein
MLDFKIRPDSGAPYEVTATTRDLYVWEKAGPKRSMNKLLQDMSIVDLYQVAHVASRRRQLFEGSLEEFAQTCDMDFEVQKEEPDPTQPAPSTEP